MLNEHQCSDRRVWRATVAFLVMMAVLRDPKFFLSPRIWAEEGTVHIQSVFSHGVLESLLLPHMGYFSLFNNFVVAFGLAGFGLNGVASTTTYTSCLVMLLIVSAPLCLKSTFWDTPQKKVALAVYALLASPGEIWLNTINTQFYFCVFSSFVLLSDTESIKGWRIPYVFLLMTLGAFTGVTTVVLTPFFVFKYLFRTKAKVDGYIVLILSLGICVQTWALFSQWSADGVARFSLDTISTFPSGLLRTLCSGYRELPEVLQNILLAMLLLVSLRRMRVDRVASLPLVLAIYLAVLFTFFSLGMAGGERYGYPAAVLIFLEMLNVLKGVELPLSRVAGVIIALLFCVGVKQFGDITSYYEPHWLAFSEKNILLTSKGERYLMVFPQGAEGIWRIAIDDASWVKYRK